MLTAIHEVPHVEGHTEQAMHLFERAIQRARRVGYGLAPGRFGLRVVAGRYQGMRGEDVCPVGALLLNRPTDRDNASIQGAWEDAGVVLGVSAAWVDEFLTGFDDSDDPCGLHDDAWELGQWFRARFYEDDEAAIH